MEYEATVQLHSDISRYIGIALFSRVFLCEEAGFPVFDYVTDELHGLFILKRISACYTYTFILASVYFEDK